MSNIENLSTPSPFLTPIYRNVHMMAEIIVFSITTIYFYRKVQSLSNQMKEMETKILQLEKTITEQKTFINNKMSEMSSMVVSQINSMMRPQYTPQVMQKPQFPPPPQQPPPQQTLQPPPQQTLQPPPQQQSYQQTPQQTPQPPPQQQTPQQTPQQTLQPPPQQQTPQQTLQPPPQQQTPQPQSYQQFPMPSFVDVVVISDISTNPKKQDKMTIEEETVDEVDIDDLDNDLGPELSELK